MSRLGLWNIQTPAPSLFRLKQDPPKHAPVITPHPNIVEKIMNDDNKLVSTKPKPQKGGEEEEKPKKKKKRLPGEKMLKKLVNHKDDDVEEKKLKRILYAIKKATENEY